MLDEAYPHLVAHRLEGELQLRLHVFELLLLLSLVLIDDPFALIADHVPLDVKLSQEGFLKNLSVKNDSYRVNLKKKAQKLDAHYAYVANQFLYPA